MMTTALTTGFNAANAALSVRSNDTERMAFVFRLTPAQSAGDTFEASRLSEYQRGLNQQYLI